MKIAVVGTGYVGLVTGACLSEFGNDVTCIDVDKEKIANLCSGILPYYEPGLCDLVKRHHTIRLHFSDDLTDVQDKDFIFIAVGTPPFADGSVDLSYVLEAAKQITKHVNKNCILAIKSTVPVYTNKSLQDIVSASFYDITVVSNPEFLKEGDAVRDFFRPNRIIIGTEDDIAFPI